MKEIFFIKVTLFFTGAAIMVIELLGTRIIGPYFGAGLYVWSSLITVTLTALAIGYWLGGKAADKRPEANALYFSVFLAGLWLILVPSMTGPGLTALRILGIKWGSLASAFILFAVPLILLGTVTPFAVKITTRGLNVLGTVAGNLYAVSTVGSVAGAVLTGFVLIPNFGVRKIIYFQALVLILLWVGHLIIRKKYGKGLFSIPFLAVCVFNWQAGQKLFSGEKFKVIYKAESLNGDVKVADRENERWLLIDGICNTVIDKRTGESLLEHSFYLEAPFHMNPQAKDMILLGLGGGSLAKAYKEYGVNVDGIEIDPNVVFTAKKYFKCGESVKNIYLQDGRQHIRNTKKRYDIVIFDAFSASGLPFHLCTRETFSSAKDILKEGGIVGLNVVSFFEGDGSVLWKSIYKTLRQVFPCVRIYMVQTEMNLKNIIFLASEKELNLTKNINYRNKECRKFISRMFRNEVTYPGGEGLILTDDYNPVDTWNAKISEKGREIMFNFFEKEVLLK
ncbi:MAG: fused MFS/spermidine synthase [bacterium]